MATLSRLIEPKAFFTNDVLLICADDTHAGFTGHLLNTFQQRGFRTVVVVDHGELDREAIQASMIVIINISDLYLFSPPRLDNLAEIVANFTTERKGQLLLADVRHPTGTYAQALTLYKNSVEPQRFHKWHNALTTTHASVSHFRRCGVKYEYECIEEILQVVSQHVASTIGLNPRVKDVIQPLYSESDDGVHVVGIWEDPGMGKKTIPREVYDLFAREGFHSCCFLDNVADNSWEHELVHLPQMLLSEMVGNLVDMVGNNCTQFGNFVDTVGDNYVELGNFEEGMSVIKRALNQKKVLIILVGINRSDLVKAVVQLTDCLGPGSRVIITVEDKCLLESHGIETIYEVKRLNRTLARQLLCLEAFSSMKTDLAYMNIIDRAETCASGNPLALEVIASNLRGKTAAECKSALDHYEGIPDTDLIPNMDRENNRKQLPKDLEENMEFGTRRAQPDRSKIWDPMELEYQLCSPTLLEIAF